MAEQKKGGFCATCEKNVVVFRKGTNHILHAIITLFSFGFWVIVWIACAIKFGGWRCMDCGSKTVDQVR